VNKLSRTGKNQAASRRGRRSASARNVVTERRRLAWSMAVIVVVWCVFVIRLWTIQVTNGPEYAKMARKQSTGKVEIPAQRGVMYDRFGKEVAVNVIRYSAYVHPRSSKEARSVGKYFDTLLGKKAGYTQKQRKIKSGKFSWVRRGLSDKQVRRIRADAQPGVYIRKEQGRKYPFGAVGKQILGYTDIDNNGISGVESRFDSTLSGVAGIAVGRKDGHSNFYQVDEQAQAPSLPGKSLALTIDWDFQEIVEEELRGAVEEYNAKGAAAVFLDCNTGEILATAHYDPSEKNPERPTKLRSITDLFEPGSIYKVITAAAILDEGLAPLDSLIDCEDGRWLCGRRYLNDDEEHGELSFHDIITFSSNIGVAKLAIALGGKKLAAASQRFGIGQKTMVEFPGEQGGTLHTDMKWSDYNVAALSIGHSVSTTPLRMALMVAAVANGGTLYRPRLVRGVIGADGEVRDFSAPEELWRVMKPRSVAPLQAMLKNVVDSGTAQKVQSEIVSIAGKTGTAEVPRPDGKGYFKNKFDASFAGYFPTDSPLIAGIVLLHQPEPIHYGGHTSGPAFRRIAEKYALANPAKFGPASHRLTLERGNSAYAKKNIKAPNFIGLTPRAAINKGAGSSVTVKGDFGRGNVIWQYPVAGARITPGATVAIQTQAPLSKGDQEFQTPDVVGMSARQASLLLTRLNVPFALDGVGKIVSQKPTSGSIMRTGGTLTLRCQQAGKKTYSMIRPTTGSTIWSIASHARNSAYRKDARLTLN
jgi:cell division protein FtsI (penicillin-binding protein 3)